MTHKERGQVEEAFNRVNRAYGALAADRAFQTRSMLKPSPKDSAWDEAMAELRATKGTLDRLLLPKPAKVKP